MTNSKSARDKNLPKRRRPTHGVYIPPSGHTIVFVTVCTKDRDPWLATATHHAILRDVWYHAKAWLFGRYVIMPDHIHFFTAPGFAPITLDAWIQYWKSQFSKRRCPTAGKWETGHWDTRLRRGESYDEKSRYVLENPVRRELVTRPEDWPFQGEIYPLLW